MALLPAWNLAMNAANATVLKIISRLEPVTKPAVLYTLSRMLLFRPVRIGVWVLQCIFTDIILSVDNPGVGVNEVVKS